MWSSQMPISTPRRTGPGSQKKERMKTDKLVRQCPNCLKLNASTDRYCSCGMALTLEAMSTREARRQAMKEDLENALEVIRELLVN